MLKLPDSVVLPEISTVLPDKFVASQAKFPSPSA